MRTLFTALALCSPAVCQADVQYFDYKDWSVIVETVDTGEDMRMTCRAFTGGDGMPSMGFEMSNGDAGPPAAYPVPTLREVIYRGYPTPFQDGLQVTFVPDNGAVTTGQVSVGFDESDFPWAIAQPAQNDSLQLLQSMRRSHAMSFTIAGEPFHFTASMSGFTAAYGKMAEQCEFSIIGVID
jgi:hypothetical protein